MKTSKIDYQLFEQYCAKWQAFWGLYDWEFHYEHEEDEDNCAWVRYNFEARLAQIGLNKKWIGKYTEEDIERSAFHEVCEVLLGQLSHYAGAFIAENVVEEEVHKIIRCLENRIFENFED